MTNGRGAYASGTLALSATRRYHGLLVAPLRPPLGRYLVLAKADATLLDGDREIPLFTNRWAGGVVHPAGHLVAESFRLEGRMPCWRFAVGDLVIEQRIFMVRGEDTTCVAFRLEAPTRSPGSPLPRLRLDLLASARDHHGAMQVDGFTARLQGAGADLEVEVPELYRLHLHACGGSIAAAAVWYENFELTVEQERGLPAHDNQLRVAQAMIELEAGRWTGIVASVGESSVRDLAAAIEAALEVDAELLRRAEASAPELVAAPDFVRQLVLAADSFVFARPLPDLPEGESVIAGYPWFGDWGRDTMIALPGLTLPTGRPETAGRLLATFGRFVDRGMLPNYFPGSGEAAEYNTADAALFYVEAWRAYFAATADLEALRAAFPILEKIVEAHARGTRYGIGVDPADHLLRAGEAGVQVTWMDAKLGDWVVTPRIGKPVELNALWYNALCGMAEFAAALGIDPSPYRELAAKTRAGFTRFRRPEGGLYDVLDGPQGHEDRLRPNQILAVSLHHSPLDRETQREVVDRCARYLLTSYGLRSLAPGDPDYRGIYRGGPFERDGSYHQGPVWAWLLGPYALAEFRVTGDAAAAQRRLAPLADHLRDAALGSVSEIFDGDAPHTPRGAPAQAWSVACALDAWWRLEKAR